MIHAMLYAVWTRDEHDPRIHPLGQLVLAALLILALWKGAHHVRSLLTDLGDGERDGVASSFLYGIALVRSVLVVAVVVVRLKGFASQAPHASQA